MKMTFMQHLENRRELLHALDELVSQRREKPTQQKTQNPPKK